MTQKVDVQRIYGRSPKPLCPPHLFTLQYYSLLRFFVRKPATTFGSLQLCPEIIDVLYPDCAQFIESFFQRFSSRPISKHNAVRQTVQCIHHRISKTKLSQIVFCMPQPVGLSQLTNLPYIRNQICQLAFSLPNKSNLAFFKVDFIERLAVKIIVLH